MSRKDFLNAVGWGVLTAAAVPLLLVLPFVGASFMGMPLGLFWVVGATAGALGGAIVLWLFTALAVYQSRYVRFLIVGLGLPAAAAVAASALQVADRVDLAQAYAVYAALFWPVALGGAALYRAVGRKWLPLVGAVVVPLLILATLVIPVPDSLEIIRWSRSSVFVGDVALIYHLYRRMPGEPLSRRSIGWGAAFLTLLTVAVFITAGVRQSAANGALVRQAKLLYEERYPDVALTAAPAVSRGKDGSVVVHLPVDGWTYRVTFRKGQVEDDGFAQRAAARLADEYAARLGWKHRPILPADVWYFGENRDGSAVGVNWQGEYLVRLYEATGMAAGVVDVYHSRVIGGHRLPPEVNGAKEVVSAHFRDRLGNQQLFIAWFWEHDDGVWEYGISQTPALGYSYVLVRDGRVVTERTHLTVDEWAPPHF